MESLSGSVLKGYMSLLATYGATIPPPDQRIQLDVGAGIMAAIAGGLSNAGIASSVAGSMSGIIYGTGAGYLSGVRQWSYGGVSQGRADSPVSMGTTYTDDMFIPKPGGRISSLDQAIADAAKEDFFRPTIEKERIYSQIRDIERREPVVVQGPPIPRPPVIRCP